MPWETIRFYSQFIRSSVCVVVAVVDGGTAAAAAAAVASQSLPLASHDRMRQSW